MKTTSTLISTRRLQSWLLAAIAVFATTAARMATPAPAARLTILVDNSVGILPMLEQVKQQSGRPIHLVIGGFHLLDQPVAEVRRIAASMQTLGVKHVGATHCTGDAAIHVFRDFFGDRYVGAGVGAVINIPLVPKKS